MSEDIEVIEVTPQYGNTITITRPPDVVVDVVDELVAYVDVVVDPPIKVDVVQEAPARIDVVASVADTVVDIILDGAIGPMGPQGQQGAKGDTGAAGPTGPIGPQGLKGDPGQQGPQGFAGPQGATGATGLTGPPGADGPQGIPGTAGPTGSQGPQGVKGDTGAAGTPGATGAQGPQGIPGADGATGATGAPGATGPQGVKGDTGLTGATGSQGPQGVKGDTGTAGATGAQGPQGVKGDTGPTGATGSQGPQGVKGDPGVAGTTGAQGPQGIQGPTGATGTAGAPGATGPPGPTAVSTDAGNIARLGTDTLLYVPPPTGTIISGSGPPAAGTGNLGDYYLDAANDILYGPKQTAPIVQAFDTVAAPATVTSGAQANSNGNRITFNRAGLITALWFYRSGSSTQTTRAMRLYRASGQVLVASATSSGESGSGWKSVALTTPIRVAAGESMTIVVDYVLGDSYSYKSPFASDTTDITFNQGLYATVLGGYPTGDAGVANYLHDVTFQADTWPVALASGADEVWIGIDAPTDGLTELWFDSDAQFSTPVGAKPWNLPWGFIVEALVTAQQAGITANVDLAGLSVTWTAVAGRRYRISAKIEVFTSTANDVPVLSLMDGSAGKDRATLTLINTFAENLFINYVESNIPAGSATRKLQLQRALGSGSLTMNCGAGNPAYIRVEDVGPLVPLT